tara:strand:+ start:7341 stop:7547 length:207 start_codon:yes stop_codon:yes gene_type:complete
MYQKMTEVVEVENTFTVNEEIKVTISLDEVKLMVNVIDVVTKRGGFTPRDFSAVGKLYETMIKNLENL